jgi:hypothetical protein
LDIEEQRAFVGAITSNHEINGNTVIALDKLIHQSHNSISVDDFFIGVIKSMLTSGAGAGDVLSAIAAMLFKADLLPSTVCFFANTLMSQRNYPGAILLLSNVVQTNEEYRIFLVEALFCDYRFGECLAEIVKVPDSISDVNIIKQLMVKLSIFDKHALVSEWGRRLADREPSSENKSELISSLLLSNDFNEAERLASKSWVESENSPEKTKFLDLKIQALLSIDGKMAAQCAIDNLNSVCYSTFTWKAIIQYGDTELLSERLADLRSLIGDSEQPWAMELYFELASGYEKLRDQKSFIETITIGNDLCAKIHQPNYVRSEFEHLLNTECRAPVRHEIDHGKPTPIFIVGLPRSGTTLLEKMLSFAPGLTCMGELDLFELAVRGNGDIAETYFNLVGAKSDFFTDKMPHNFRYINEIMHAIPHAKVIVVRRCINDIALSIYKHQFCLKGHPYASNIRDIAHHVFHANKFVDNALLMYGSRILSVNYNDIIKNPSSELQKVYGYCGLKWDDKYLNRKASYVGNTFSKHQVGKNIYREKLDKTNMLGYKSRELSDELELLSGLMTSQNDVILT